MAIGDVAFVSFAQNHEDVVLYRALQDVTAGFYMDVGAYDPVIHSVTKAFYDRGWHGINLEPSVSGHARLAIARRRDVNLNLAAWNSPGELTLHDIADTGLSTVVEQVAAGHRARLPARQARVAAATLKDICVEHGVVEIHFLKVDAEGAEREVLEGMDFGAIRPWIVVVEALDPLTHRPTHAAWERILVDADYELALFDGLNRFYFDRARPQLKERLAAPANTLDNYVPATLRGDLALPLPGGFGINIVATIGREYSLGYTARAIARSLIDQGIPVSIANLHMNWDATPPSVPEDLKEHMVASPDELPHPVNLYVLPLSFLAELMQTLPQLFDKPRIHAVNLWWEATHLPEAFRKELERHDVLLVHSDFLAGVAATSAPLVSVVNARLPWAVPDTAPDRARFGLPEAATVFVLAFDANSDPARKNPHELVQAFRAAFPGGEDVCLVIRVTYADTEAGQAAVAALRRLAGDDARVRLVLEPLDREGILSLYASADVYVSLHRCEGLGLGMLEAMALGKAVIATGWSGNSSFMDASCACLVRYRMVRPDGNHWFYRAENLPPEALWAEPVIEDAIAWMQALHRHRPFREALGRRARLRHARYQREANACRWVNELASLWETWRVLPRVAGRYSTAAA